MVAKNTTILLLSAIAFATFNTTARAQQCDSCLVSGDSVSACDSSCGLTCDVLVSCENPSWSISGWLNGGFLSNNHNPASNFNGAYNQADRDGGMFNQAYLILDKPVEKSNATILGGRIDLLYGHDFFLAQSKGFENNPDGSLGWNNEDYGLALPQAYASVGNSDRYIRAGHFYTPIGFEGVPAPNNFFYTKSNSYMFAGPFTHWGAIGTVAASDRLTFDSGIVNGWDALDRTSDQLSFLSKVSIGGKTSPTKFSFGIITGGEQNANASDYTTRSRYSAILSQDIGCRTQYVFHHWLGTQDRYFADGESAAWYGIDQYLFYTLNKNWKAAFRGEWFRDEEGVRIGLNRPSNPNNPPYIGDLYSISFGLNWFARESITIRPELRYDWFQGTGNPFNDNLAQDQFVTGFDAIWTF